MLQLLGAGGFGVLLGWQLYFLNRYRAKVALSDLGSVLAVIGGAAVLKLFPQGSDLFGAYGIGLCFGFFSYLLVLVLLVRRSSNFTLEWFIDGRSRPPSGGENIPTSAAGTTHPMESPQLRPRR